MTAFPTPERPWLRGAFTALVTPFTADGELDEAEFRRLVTWQVLAGIDGLVPVGTTGESPTVDMKEHARIIELTVQYAAGRVPVIAGTGANATTEAVELHSIAKKVGATACLSSSTTGPAGRARTSMPTRSCGSRSTRGWSRSRRRRGTWSSSR